MSKAGKRAEDKNPNLLETDSGRPLKLRIDTSHMPKLELVPLLIDAAVAWTRKFGVEKILEGLPGPVKVADGDRLSILYQTPKSMASIYGGSNYCLDIWVDGKKVFCVCWNSQFLKDYAVVNFKRGPWISMLLGDMG